MIVVDPCGSAKVADGYLILAVPKGPHIGAS
jgi:hypothetical protein